MMDVVEVLFPLQGVDQTTAYDQQPAKTTFLGKNVRSMDPIEERNRGGSRHGLIKFADQVPAGTHLIQNLTQLVDPRADNLLANFGDFQPGYIPDPRNAARLVPPQGSGAQPNLGFPRATYRRVQLSADNSTPTDGQTVTLTAALTLQPAGTPVSGATIRLATIPPNQNGYGASAVTGGAGTCQFMVSETDFEGPIVYLASNTYSVPGVPFLVTARGICKVTWKQNYTLTLDSPDGISLPSDGKAHRLNAVLTDNTTGLPVPGRSIVLGTSPISRVGDGSLKITDSKGKAVFTVSDATNEIIDYTASLLPRNRTSPVITATVEITWGTPVGALDIGRFNPGVGWQATPQNLGHGNPTIIDANVNLHNTITPAPDGIIVTLKTNPAGRVGDGLTAPTLSGAVTFTVTETGTGLIFYSAASVSQGSISPVFQNNFPVSVAWA